MQGGTSADGSLLLHHCMWLLVGCYHVHEVLTKNTLHVQRWELVLLSLVSTTITPWWFSILYLEISPLASQGETVFNMSNHKTEISTANSSCCILLTLFWQFVCRNRFKIRGKFSWIFNMELEKIWEEGHSASRVTTVIAKDYFSYH